jgi:predicted metal-dependent enzyme (double-stranded beta helix superfamily)
MTGLSMLVGAVSDVLDAGGDLDVVTGRIAGELSQVIAGPGLEELFAGKRKSYTAYTDPRRHFIVHCSVHHPGHLTEAHDHGEAWAVYGVVQGVSRYRRFSRQPDQTLWTAALRCVRDEELALGQTDVVSPGEVHLIGNETDEMALNVVVRPRPIEDVWRRRFNLITGAYVIHPSSLRAQPAADSH